MEVILGGVFSHASLLKPVQQLQLQVGIPHIVADVLAGDLRELLVLIIQRLYETQPTAYGESLPGKLPVQPEVDIGVVPVPGGGEHDVIQIVVVDGTLHVRPDAGGPAQVIEPEVLGIAARTNTRTQNLPPVGIPMVHMRMHIPGRIIAHPPGVGFLQLGELRADAYEVSGTAQREELVHAQNPGHAVLRKLGEIAPGSRTRIATPLAIDFQLVAGGYIPDVEGKFVVKFVPEIGLQLLQPGFRDVLVGRAEKRKTAPDPIV